MEVFEIHITGDESIHSVAGKYNHKTIAIDLLRPNLTCLRVEHMTSLIFKYQNENAYEECKKTVDEIVGLYKKDGVQISRVKIECPYIDHCHYKDQSMYIESHFKTEDNHYPVSRNQKKTTLLATDREYDLDKYQEFVELHHGRELELCLHDTNPTEDIEDWMWLFDSIQNIKLRKLNA